MLLGQNKMPYRGSVRDWFRDAFKGGTGTPMMMHQKISFPQDKWPADCPPITVAILSDLHMGCPAMSLVRLDDLIRRVNAEKPDLILLIGDYTNTESLNGRYMPPEEFVPAFKQLQARYGVYATKGNHDNVDDRNGVIDAFANNGIRLLENDAVRIDRPDQDEKGIWLVGLPDQLTDTIDLKAAFAKVTSPEPVIVMAHNPLTFFKMDERVALTMSGHNHAGQCRIPFVGAIYLPVSTTLRYAYGHIHEDNKDLFVGPGLGTSGLPLRVFCPAGVPLLKLGHG